jgi:uncharacterized pyridoxamine 5'-phosphate oxidase family protein
MVGRNYKYIYKQQIENQNTELISIKSKKKFISLALLVQERENIDFFKSKLEKTFSLLKETLAKNKQLEEENGNLAGTKHY